MQLDDECRDAIDIFWKRAGTKEDFPRTLEHPIALGLPVALVKLPCLALQDIESWLRFRGVHFTFDSQNRSVRGCMVAFHGKGIIFIDGADSANEIRFTIAHELGHFLIDYWVPREKATHRFGSTILDVMDGLRPPNISERLSALLDHRPIGIHADLLERSQAGDASSETWKVESRADMIALELLAPRQIILAQTVELSKLYKERQTRLTGLLIGQFGLPERIAKVYASNLLVMFGKGPSFAETVRLSQ